MTITSAASAREAALAEAKERFGGEHYRRPVDELLERDVLAGLAMERYRALELYGDIRADAFVAHPLHPFIFGTLRRCHLGGAGHFTYEEESGPDKRPRLVVVISGFTTVFDEAYPKAGGSGPALALLRDAIAGACIFDTSKVRTLLELRERRRLLSVIEERALVVKAELTVDEGLGPLEDLHELATTIAEPSMGPLLDLAPILAGLDIELVPWNVTPRTP